MTRSARWRRTAHAGRAGVRLLLFAIAITAGLGTGSAYAGYDAFCSGCTASAGLEVLGPAHSLTAVRGTNNSGGVGCGGAYGYGSYFCGDPAGCHTYGGGNVLTPGVRHPYGYWRAMSGYSTWGSTGPPSNCSYSSVYGTGDAGARSARNPDGIPALDRAPVQAPDALGSFVPGADLSSARTFATPAGDGYVVVDAGRRLICIVIDDRGTGYGYGCQRIGQVQAAGLLVSLEDADGSTAAGDLVVAIAAEGVAGVTVGRRDGSSRDVPAEGGVVVASLGSEDVSVTLPAAVDAPAGVKARRLVAAR